jgi:hypothetical protein
VFVHALMPWKVAIELGRVMKPGAIPFVVAPQASLIHEEASDFFHFSVHAWVRPRCSTWPRASRPSRHGRGKRRTSGIDFLASHCALASAVMFRKMGDTSLDCPFRPTPS